MSEAVATPVQDQSAAPVGATGAADDAMKVSALKYRSGAVERRADHEAIFIVPC